MANSKFDESLLEPIDENQNSTSGFNQSLLSPIEEEEEQFLQPKQEGISSWLPRDIAIGLSNLGHKTLNTPYDMAKNISQQGESVNKMMPLEKYIGNNRLPDNKSYLQQMVESFNQDHNVPQELRNEEWNKLNVEKIPHQQEHDFAKLLGQKGTPSTGDQIIQKGIEYAPEILGGAQLLKHFSPQRLKDIFSSRKLNKNAKSLESEIKDSEETLSDIESQLPQEANQSNLLQNKSNEQIGNYLNAGATHSARGASAIGHRLENIENYWKKSYKDLKTTLKDSEFKMDKLPQYEQDLDYAIKNIKDLEIIDGKFVIKNQPEVSSELQSIINKAPTSKDVTADNFLTKYQDFRDARYDLLQRAKEGKTSSERKALFKAYDDSKEIESSVSKALNQGLGPHKTEFQRVNEGYSKQVYPLRSNRVAKKALEGKLGPNTMAELEGTGEGQELMREIVKQDPELLRNIVGQRYASKPEALKEISETSAEYLYEMPELRRIMAEHEAKIGTQLEKVNKLKNQKEISLKQKVELEKQHKELKDKISRINKDKSRIWKATKKVAKVGGALYVGGNVLNKYLGK